jgi:hypothetical protein
VGCLRVLQAAVSKENFLLISKRLDLRDQVAARGCHQAAVTNVALKWLHANGLDVDPSKCELMIFHKTHKHANLLGGEITEAQYLDSTLGPNTIKTTKSLKYLGIYIDHCLCWTKHMEIMTNCGKSNICGINILDNSIRGLDFLNWRKVFNALVIPSMTYGVQVWYTGTKQRGLIQKIQVTQNEGIRKITGVFQTSPVEPLHNLTAIPPVSYLLKKINTSFTNRLRAMAPKAKVQAVLTDDWC